MTRFLALILLFAAITAGALALIQHDSPSHTPTDRQFALLSRAQHMNPNGTCSLDWNKKMNAFAISCSNTK